MATGERSSKYDHIACKTLIHSGSPTVYRLTPEYKRVGTLEKYILGERNANKPNKTVLLVGESGAGKSTLINALVNYAIGVKWEENVYFDILGDEVKDQSASQTIDVIVYQIFGFEEETLPYSLTIIDTPGYGSTGGPEHDAVVQQQLFDLFSSQDGIHEINAVGLVMKSSDNRLSDRLSYIFDSVTSLFGKDVVNNVVALMTYSNGQEPEDALNALKAAKIRYATDDENQPVYFLFDNCEKKNRSKNVKFLKNSDEISREGLEGFAEFLGQILPLKLAQTVEVMNERIKLTACINSLQDKVRFLKLKRQEIEQMQEALKKHEEDMEKNTNFIITVDEPYKEKESTGSRFRFFNRVTTCPDCEENCHFACTFAFSKSWCKAMVNGRCTVCTNKCEASSHVRDTFKYVVKTQNREKTLEDVKKKYQESERGKEEKRSLLDLSKNEIKSLDNELTKLLDESFQHVKRLDQIALNVDSMSTYVHLDFLIEKLKERKDQGKVEELTRMKQRMIQKVKGWRYYAIKKTWKNWSESSST